MSDRWFKMTLGCPFERIGEGHPWRALTNDTTGMVLWCPACDSLKEVAEHLGGRK